MYSNIRNWWFGSKNLEPLRVMVSGAAGQVAHILLPLLVQGDVFGKKQPISLVLLDSEAMLDVLNEIALELKSCAWPLLTDVVATADFATAFRNIDVAVLFNAKSKQVEMESSENVKANAKLFREYGEALSQYAKITVKIVIAGDLANTNTFICKKYAPGVPSESFTCLSRLDQNIAQSVIAMHIGVSAQDVRNVVIWGTLVSHVEHAVVTVEKVEMRVSDAIQDADWLKSDFIKEVQERRTVATAHQKLSRSLSAPKAICDHLHDWYFGTKDGCWVSMGIPSDGSYGVEPGLIFSFPVRISRNGTYSVVTGLWINDFVREKIDVIEKELQQERDLAVEACLKKSEEEPILRCSSGICGLQNVDNNCYVNATVQVLRHIPSITAYFSDEQNLTGTGPVTEAFSVLVRRLWSGIKLTNARSFKEVVGRVNNQFSTLEQQDCMEFFAYLLNSLHSDLIGTKETEDDSEKDVGVQESIVSETFRGLQRSQVVCVTCCKPSVTYDPFMFISLAIPVTENLLEPNFEVEDESDLDSTRKRLKITLEDCLLSYTSEEVLEYST